MTQPCSRIASIKPRNLRGVLPAIALMKNLMQKSAGFSLVEVMVAMVIGLLGIIIMLQVYTNFEAQKRTTSGGDDAQNAAVIALYGLQRDVQDSGWGISASGVLGCSLTLPASGVIPARIIGLAPVTINPVATVIPAGDANTDTILVVKGNGNGGQEGDQVTEAPPTGLGGINIFKVASPNEFQVNDRVIPATAIQPAPCNLALDTVTAVAGTNVSVATGLAAMKDGHLYNLGQTQSMLAYAVRNSNLTVCDYASNDCGNPANTANKAIWVPVANNIVSMRAQYGRDTLSPVMPVLPSSPPFPTYTVDIFDQATPINSCGWSRTLAIRLVLVARNNQTKQTNVTPNVPAWGGSVASAALLPVPGNVATPIVLSAGWQNNRYKVFETIIPIRNITTQWGKTGC
jgi:type IV pilus assembly protein PilW